MRLTLIASVFLAAANVDAFAPALNAGRSVSSLQSTVEAVVATEYNSKLEAQLTKMAAKDAGSKISADVSLTSIEEVFPWWLCRCDSYNPVKVKYGAGGVKRSYVSPK